MKISLFVTIIIALVIMCTILCIAVFAPLTPLAREIIFSLGLIIPGGILLLALREERIYRCSNCGHEFSPTDKEMVGSKGSSISRKLKCPSCGQVCEHTRIYKK